jgi:hypothetical protein
VAEASDFFIRRGRLLLRTGQDGAANLLRQRVQFWQDYSNKIKPNIRIN